jgi:hypothetical protein
MSERDVVSVEGLGLADAIALLRDELLRARAAGGMSEIQLPVESMTVQLTMTASRSVDGKAGFKVPFLELELGGGASRERGSARWHGADGRARGGGGGKSRGARPE